MQGLVVCAGFQFQARALRGRKAGLGLNSLSRSIGGGACPGGAVSSEAWGCDITANCACVGRGAGCATAEARARERKRGLGLNSSSGGPASRNRGPTAGVTGCGRASNGFGQENEVGWALPSLREAEDTLQLCTADGSRTRESWTSTCSSAALGAPVDKTRTGRTRRSDSFCVFPLPPRPPTARAPLGSALNDTCFNPAARRAEAPLTGAAVSSEPALAR